jgi:hypothetical protein
MVSRSGRIIEVDVVLARLCREMLSRLYVSIVQRI